MLTLAVSDNIDYNSLKHHIKAHTTRDQATAIAIPGRPNTALKKFEDDFYAELCGQHARVGMFVASKADEIARRLRMLLFVSNTHPRDTNTHPQNTSPTKYTASSCGAQPQARTA